MRFPFHFEYFKCIFLNILSDKKIIGLSVWELKGIGGKLVKRLAVGHLDDCYIVQFA